MKNQTVGVYDMTPQSRKKEKVRQIVGIKRYSHDEIHEFMCDRWLTEAYKNKGDYIDTQALFCPYYVPLSGPLGADWGIIVNPKSNRFLMPTFEHDFCGCPDHYRKHGNQDGRDWIKDFKDYAHYFTEEI